MVLTLVRLGETDRARQVLAGLSEQDRKHADFRIATAALRLAHDDPHAAHAALGPVVEPSAPINWRIKLALGPVAERWRTGGSWVPSVADGRGAGAARYPDVAFAWFWMFPGMPARRAAPAARLAVLSVTRARG